MALSLKPGHLGRYKDIARLFVKYGHSRLLPPGELGDLATGHSANPIDTQESSAEELADDLEAMGPLYIKLGQVLSSRPDLLPDAYVVALSRLQDGVAPCPFSELEAIVVEELGVRLSKAFASFDPEPIAVASLGQVHRATLRDGRAVAVKIQRPGIRKQIAEDFEALAEIADFIDNHTDLGRRYGFLQMLEELRTNLARELDYRQEANNLVKLAHNLKEFDRILIPQPVEDYTTSCLLTMDFVPGRKITSLSALARLDLDGAGLAEVLHKAYLKQILVDGFFHADPHPGNVFITGDGRLALLDLGMVGHISHDMQEKLLKLLLAMSEGEGEEAADLAISIGEVVEPFAERTFRSRVAQLVVDRQDSSIAELQVGRLLLEFSRVAGDNGLRMPPELTMLSKTLLNLDEAARVLDPSFRPSDAIRRNAAGILRERTLQSLTPAHLFTAAMEAKEFTQELPGRVNRILDLLAKNQVKVRVEAIDEATLMEGFQKVANRIAVGLVLAALIIGAAMLMRVETHFRLFGYPGLAMVCFLGAAGGGAWLVISILLQDRAGNTRGRRPT